MKKALLHNGSQITGEIYMFDEHYDRNVYSEGGEQYIHVPGAIFNSLPGHRFNGLKIFKKNKKPQPNH